MTAIVAAAQYPIDALTSWDDYVRKLDHWLTDAAIGGANLALFPEYAAMELASIEASTRGDLLGSLNHVAALISRIDELHADHARRLGMYILAASAPVRLEDGRIVNRARLFGPSGTVGWQDKQVMTRFERETWSISRGEGLKLFETRLGRLGVLICYDAEFPLLARRLVEAGAEILLVPSCTDTRQGYWRVRLACQARALEGQCHVIQAPTVGTAPWSPALDVNTGAAGVFGPPDGDFPDDGILALGKMDQPGWVFGRIDVERTRQVRAQGAVLNHRDWSETQTQPDMPRLEPV